MPDVFFIPIISILIVLWIVAIGGAPSSDGVSLLLLIIAIPASLFVGRWIQFYNREPWQYLEPRYVEIEKRGDKYIAVDIEGQKVYNILSIIGRVPKDNEILELKKRDTSKIYCGISSSSERDEMVVIEKKTEVGGGL